MDHALISTDPDTVTTCNPVIDETGLYPGGNHATVKEFAGTFLLRGGTTGGKANHQATAEETGF
jgi:hypothetical protein